MRDKFVFIPSTEMTRHNLLRLKGEELRVRDELVAVALDIFKRHKAAGKGKEDTAIATMTRSFGRDNHTALWSYEKAHLAAGEDWAAVSAELKRVVDGQQRRRILVHEFLNSFADHNRGTAQLEGVVDPVRQVYVKLGTVFLGDARFTELRPQPPGLKNAVYVLGRVMNDKLVQDPNHTSSHFVWLPNSKTYVRRFVVRGLNHNDIVNVKSATPLGAPVQTVLAQRREVAGLPKQTTRHNVAEDSALSEVQQILSHTRGWQKRYISTGVSNRPVYSTRGTQFISLYGTAVIDLAKVDLTQVWDVHSPIAVRNVMKWDARTVVTAGGPGSGAKTLKEEEFLALRDVLRTRELLIKFQVPYAALHCNPDGNRIIGIGANDYDGPERFLRVLQGWRIGWAKVKGHEALNYRGYNGKHWLFLVFANETDAGWFYAKASVRERAEWLRLIRYEMPMSLEGWK